MNQAGLTADMICMFEGRLESHLTAKFEELMERYFIAGAARIDLIAKVIDLDNAIGGYNFDLLNLQETINELESLRTIGGKIMIINLTLCSYTILYFIKRVTPLP